MKKYPPITIDFSWDDLVPRDEDNRYRIYSVRGGKLHLVGTAPTGPAWGLAVTYFHKEGEFNGHDCAVGVLDTHATTKRRGTWIVNPFCAGGSRDE